MLAKLAFPAPQPLLQQANISVDESMVRALAKKPEAQRAWQARNIIADSEVNTAHKLAEAAKTLKTADGAMHLRELQTYLEMAQEKCSTIVLPSNLGAFLGSRS